MLTITAGNPDLDGDGTRAFEVAPTGNPGEGRLRIADPDDVDHGVAGQFSTLTIQVDDQDPANPLTDTFIIKVATTSRFTESSEVGNVLINEVLWAKPNPAVSNQEFVELYNPTNNTISLNGWRLGDSETATDPAEVATFSHTFGNVSIGPDERLVVWTGSAGGNRSTAFAPNFWANSAGPAFAKTDDVWLFDGSGALVAFIAWGNDGNANPANDDYDEIFDRPPIVSWNLWDPTYESSLGTGAFIVQHQSLSLTPDGDPAAAVLSACWEPTGGDLADQRCPEGPLPTLDSDSTTRIASTGQDNN